VKDIQIFKKELNKTIEDYQKNTDGTGFNFKSKHMLNRMLKTINKEVRKEENDNDY